jgi:hypothetical protein
MLSGVGAAITLAALAALSQFARPAMLRLIGLLACGTIIVAFGETASIKTSQAHREVWERHRSAIAQILAVAPRIRPEP